MRAPWPSEYLILGLLCERATHGYELAQLVTTDEALRTIWGLKSSEVYFLLRKLLERGLIEESGEIPATEAIRSGASHGGPRRVNYTATPAGRALLEQWVLTPVTRPRDLRAAFLAKLYLALRRGPSVAIGLLRAQRALLESWHAHLTETYSEDPFVMMARVLRLSQVDSSLRALEEIEASLPITR